MRSRNEVMEDLLKNLDELKKISNNVYNTTTGDTLLATLLIDILEINLDMRDLLTELNDRIITLPNVLGK